MNPDTNKFNRETSIMNSKKFWAVCLCLVLIGSVNAQEDEHDDHEGEGEENTAIEMTADQQREAGIIVERVARRAISEIVRVPAEVVINAYASSRVTPRITAQVAKRHVQLGDHVTAGQPLVTLSSVEMAEAQGMLIVADREWQRVKALGRKTVSERRYTEAQVAQQQAIAKVLAYGMTDKQATSLMKSGDASKAIGAFDLLASQSGTILMDDFIVGELIDPGRVLIEISDETVMWVEAQTIPNTLPGVARGTAARVSLDGIRWLEGTVIQLHHRLNETTRTQGLRIAVQNIDDQLHAGQFVEAEIENGVSTPELAVPSTAVTMIDGRPTVFKLEDGHEFHAEAINAGPTIGDWVIVEGGLTTGDEIAVAGVFYLKSMLLKSSIGSGHAH